MLKKIIKILKNDHSNPSKNIRSTEFEVDNWRISNFVIKKLLIKVGYHPFPLSELSLMSASVCYFKPTHIFEWGTHIGKSARIFYETAKYFNINTEIHSIDLPDESPHAEHPGDSRGKLIRHIESIKLHQGDGVDTSLSIIKNINSECKPLFFIDGDHSYESVKRELSTIIKNVPNATIILHDTFYQSEDSNYNIGPWKAINEALEETENKYKKITTNTGLPGMTLLYRK
ncbi:MAG: class I SAM-dependent methyltransferase [Candidatus Paceibacterota bacterium]